MTLISDTQIESSSRTIIDLCNARLADAVDLRLQCKHAHWNVKGPGFSTFHELFDKVSDEVEDYIDLIAERAVQLGGVADSTKRVVATWSHVLENDEVNNEEAYAQHLANALTLFGESVREAINHSNSIDDFVTADVFTGILRGVDKWHWMLQAHLH